MLSPQPAQPGCQQGGTRAAVARAAKGDKTSRTSRAQALQRPARSRSRAEACDSCKQDDISDAIFTLIPEVSRLRALFLCWSGLGAAQRSLLEQLVEAAMSASGSGDRSAGRARLYRSLLLALQRWERLQDTEGAPGCWPGLALSSDTPHLEEELAHVVRSIENLLDNIAGGAEDTDTFSSDSSSSASRCGTPRTLRRVQYKGCTGYRASSGYHTD